METNVMKLILTIILCFCFFASAQQVIHSVDVTVLATYPGEAIEKAKTQVKSLGHSPTYAKIISGNGIIKLWQVRVECWCSHKASLKIQALKNLSQKIRKLLKWRPDGHCMVDGCDFPAAKGNYLFWKVGAKRV